MKAILFLGIGAVLAGMFQPPAKPPIKMGLWEITSTSTMSGDGLPAAMSGMSGHPVTARYCLDEATYQKSLGSSDRDRNCTRSNEVWGAKSFSADVSCSSGMKMHVDVTIESMESYRTALHGTMSMRGTAVKLDTTGTSKFVSADCGNVQPGGVRMGH